MSGVQQIPDSFCSLINGKCKNHLCKWYVRNFVDEDGVEYWDCVVVDVAQSLEHMSQEVRNGDQ